MMQCFVCLFFFFVAFLIPYVCGDWRFVSSVSLFRFILIKLCGLSMFWHLLMIWLRRTVTGSRGMAAHAYN